jgi:pimeloyl-ACP methyl ester carboxylesterase
MRIFFTACLLFFFTVTYCQPSAITVEKNGKGNPVLFLPGFTSPGTVWNETLQNLKEQKQSHLVSYAGFNGIAPIDTPWYSSIKTALLQYIQKEKLSNLTIIGHSMGGTLAIDIAATLPDKVNKLILVDAIPCMRALMMPGVEASQLQYNSPYNQQMLQMDAVAFGNMAAMMATNMTSNQQKVDTLVQWSKAADRNTFVYGYTDLLRLDLRDALKKVKAETLILGAPFPSVAAVTPTFEQQYANLANKTIALAPSGKHFIMFDQPLWFYDKVNAFLSK